MIRRTNNKTMAAPSPKPILKSLSELESKFDRWKFERRVKKGKLGEVVVFPYRGFGNGKEIYVKGRVLESNGLAKPHPEDSTWTNIKAMAKRYLSREVPNVYLKASFQGKQQLIKVTGDGYFTLQMTYDKAVNPMQLWHQVEFELIDRSIGRDEAIIGTGEIMIPDQKSEYGIISDIDDTVLISNTTNSIEIVKMALLNNATTRSSFQGVASFYQALQAGSQGDSHNPVFYVSSSPWNMYDMLEDFFEINGLPKGPILLRDIGLTENRLIKGKHSKHKLEKIRRILNFNPKLSFIMLGDSGQHDPEIYQQAVEEFPGRIKAIYIRNVTTEARKEELSSIVNALANQGVDMVLKSNTSDAVSHAEDAGFIVEGSKAKVRQASL